MTLEEITEKAPLLVNYIESHPELKAVNYKHLEGLFVDFIPLTTL